MGRRGAQVPHMRQVRLRCWEGPCPGQVLPQAVPQVHILWEPCGAQQGQRPRWKTLLPDLPQEGIRTQGLRVRRRILGSRNGQVSTVNTHSFRHLFIYLLFFFLIFFSLGPKRKKGVRYGSKNGKKSCSVDSERYIGRARIITILDNVWRYFFNLFFFFFSFFFCLIRYCFVQKLYRWPIKSNLISSLLLLCSTPHLFSFSFFLFFFFLFFFFSMISRPKISPWLFFFFSLFFFPFSPSSSSFFFFLFGDVDNDWQEDASWPKHTEHPPWISFAVY